MKSTSLTRFGGTFHFPDWNAIDPEMYFTYSVCFGLSTFSRKTVPSRDIAVRPSMVLYSPSSMQIIFWGNIHVGAAILCMWDGVADISDRHKL